MSQMFDNRQAPRARDDKRSDQLEATAHAKASVPPANSPQKSQPLARRIVEQVLGERFMQFLGLVKTAQRQKDERDMVALEEDYRAWAATIELLKQQFAEAWQVLQAIEQETPGWFRSSVGQGPHVPVSIGRDGYGFSMVLEQNNKANAPFPERWLIVTAGLRADGSGGLGDERMLGREGTVDTRLTGYRCDESINLSKLIEAASDLKQRAENAQIRFQLFSKKAGQQSAEIPVAALKDRKLAELCKGLFVALNADQVSAVLSLPEGQGKKLLREH